MEVFSQSADAANLALYNMEMSEKQTNSHGLRGPLKRYINLKLHLFSSWPLLFTSMQSVVTIPLWPVAG